MSKELRLLEETENAIERNRLALDLLGKRAQGLTSSLVKLIEKPELHGSRGTLVHCLGEIEPSAHFSLFVGLLITGSWEEAHEALDALAAIPELESPDVPKAIANVETALKGAPEPWRHGLLENFLGAASAPT